MGAMWLASVFLQFFVTSSSRLEDKATFLWLCLPQSCASATRILSMWKGKPHHSPLHSFFPSVLQRYLLDTLKHFLKRFNWETLEAFAVCMCACARTPHTKILSSLLKLRRWTSKEKVQRNWLEDQKPKNNH